MRTISKIKRSSIITLLIIAPICIFCMMWSRIGAVASQSSNQPAEIGNSDLDARIKAALNQGDSNEIKELVKAYVKQNMDVTHLELFLVESLQHHQSQIKIAAIAGLQQLEQ